ncbi:Threonine dehydratase, catabolic [Candidatus Rhodobacter oscarellae]|uniref:Threonine dehydratase, catabolic n=1 Tax=Candidatus Rhodobacter oscarellae TaxID=1675527 RepID=A0A0J9H4Y2_9RHOB|nr:serine/threonine dehydratase [Candidatus Rhodobacter lobularis]KMW60628.1 Threonine dehydratase, catabolic [Candidatus Rhodobacter lobularis]
MNWKTEIEAAAGRIAGHAVQTPVMQIDGFGLGHPIEAKLEQLQHTGSFKVRGAFNTMLSGPAPDGGYVAASGGNHGAAVGFAAAALGRRAKIFVPELAGAAKIALVERTGADLSVVPGTYAEALAAAQAHEAETGAQQIHAYDAPATVAGQGTLMREWEAQGLQADTVLIAVGGGGLIAGALAWLQGARKVVAVEPARAPTLHSALAAGAPVDVEVGGVAVNALGAKRIGQLCFDLAEQHLGACVTVPDDAIIAARAALWQERRLLVEPAGAAALAALMSGAYQPQPGERVAVLVCGANPDPDPL